jgi:predicted nucleic acid-binding protein
VTAGFPPTAPGAIPPLIVCNASPLIALSQIGRLDVLRELFGTVLIPPAVSSEILPELRALPAWTIHTPLAKTVPRAVVAASLGPGESESIALALERSASRLILDDRAARRLAASLGVSVVGTLGALLAAKRRGIIASVRQCLDDLDAVHFHVSPALRAQVLFDAGEAS